MRALVTGGAGFIGSHLVDALVERGVDVVVVDNLSSGRLENIGDHVRGGRVAFYRRDLKDPGALDGLLRDIDVVYHYAANPEVRVSSTEPRIHFEENIVATFNVLEAVRRSGIGELVFASSSTVYGEPRVERVREDHPFAPVSVYGASKAACESLIHSYASLYGIKATVLRYANVIGPRSTHGVIVDFVKKLLENPRRLVILGDGTQTKSYIYVSDAVEATLAAQRSHGGGFEAYNVGNLDAVTVKEIADIVVEEMGLGRVEYIYRPYGHGVGWPGDVKRIIMSIDKIMERTGWRPRYTSREAVRLTARYVIEKLAGKRRGRETGRP